MKLEFNGLFNPTKEELIEFLGEAFVKEDGENIYYLNLDRIEMVIAHVDGDSEYNAVYEIEKESGDVLFNYFKNGRFTPIIDESCEKASKDPKLIFGVLEPEPKEPKHECNCKCNQKSDKPSEFTVTINSGNVEVDRLNEILNKALEIMKIRAEQGL